MLLDFQFDYILENEEVLLRPLVAEDFDNLLGFALQEPELWKYSLVSAAGKQGMNEYINTALDGRKLEKEYPFIVYDKLNGKYAGCTRFYDIQCSLKTLQLGYTWYGNTFHETGLNKNCKFLLLELAFDKLGFERVQFLADNDNAVSIAAMQSIGCTVEGVLRSHMPKRPDGRRDSIVLSILKDEWQKTLKQRLADKIAFLKASDKLKTR